MHPNLRPLGWRGSGNRLPPAVPECGRDRHACIEWGQPGYRVQIGSAVAGPVRSVRNHIARTRLSSNTLSARRHAPGSSEDVWWSRHRRDCRLICPRRGRDRWELDALRHPAQAGPSDACRNSTTSGHNVATRDSTFRACAWPGDAAVHGETGATGDGAPLIQARVSAAAGKSTGALPVSSSEAGTARRKAA